MQLTKRADFIAGLLFLVLGVAAASMSLRYDIGTAEHMGPGYFPFLLGCLLAILGAGLIYSTVAARGEKDEEVHWDFTILVRLLIPVVIFGFILERAGLAISLMLLIVMAGAASHEFRIRNSIVTALVLSALCIGLFVYGLDLPIPLWPTF